MRVYLKKNLTADKVKLSKGDVGTIWCCLLHGDSFLVDFKDIRVEVGRTDVGFEKLEEKS